MQGYRLSLLFGARWWDDVKPGTGLAIAKPYWGPVERKSQEMDLVASFESWIKPYLRLLVTVR